MIRGVTYSRRTALLAVSMAVIATLVGAGRLQLQRSLRRRSQEAEQKAQDLAAQVGSLSGFDAAHLALLRARIQAQRELEGDALTWDRVISRLGARWRPDSLTTAEQGHRWVRRGAFTLVEPTAADWPEIEAAMHDLEVMPGVAIDTLDMAAAPQGSPRALELVRMKVVVRIGRSNSLPSSHD